ncbi:MAG: hypothetical protein Q8S13_12235 [Dehalococcoidia bacterium]|nr:hypothetical protein [Dehalococcoidia bacterium]
MDEPPAPGTVAAAARPPVEIAVPDGGQAGVAARRVVDALKKRLHAGGPAWKVAVLNAIAAWPLASEVVDGEKLDYLIGGEAFDWRLLAGRLAAAAGGAARETEVRAWLDDPDPSGGFEEAEFTRLLGVDKYRSHLNYLYGVTVERALLAAVEEEITKRRVASGQSATERARDEAYERLYEGRREALWADFCSEDSEDKARPRGRSGPSHDLLSLADLDAFTYWLFKRRLRRLDPARVASDTRKGLNQLERMRLAHERRLRARLLDKAVAGVRPEEKNSTGRRPRHAGPAVRVRSR